MARASLGLMAMLATASTVHAQQPAANDWFAIPANAMFETGDSWSDGAKKFRLYGVQACLRGTYFTNNLGLKRDCGEASLAMLAALIRDFSPRCTKAAAAPDGQTMAVFCIASPSRGAGTGARIDLGTAMIASGFAFAALTPEGQPVHPPYLVAQLVAARKNAGLWAFADMPEPNRILFKALRQSSPVRPQGIPWGRQ